MARDLDPRQQAELSEFVNALADAGRYTTTAEWARESGYPASNLSNLRNARGGVDGYNLIRLIRAAARRADLDPEALALAIGRASDEDAEEEMIARRLEEIATLSATALELLRERLPARPQAPQRAAAKRRSRKSA